MSKVTIIKTSEGTMVMGNTQCSNGAFWDAEGCFKYCNSSDSDIFNRHQAFKLFSCASLLGNDKVDEEEWWKNRNNFIDLEINYEVNQNYIG